MSSIYSGKQPVPPAFTHQCSFCRSEGHFPSTIWHLLFEGDMGVLCLLTLLMNPPHVPNLFLPRHLSTHQAHCFQILPVFVPGFAKKEANYYKVIPKRELWCSREVPDLEKHITSSFLSTLWQSKQCSILSFFIYLVRTVHINVQSVQIKTLLCVNRPDLVGSCFPSVDLNIKNTKHTDKTLQCIWHITI